jgi:hypothetical protein
MTKEFPGSKLQRPTTEWRSNARLNRINGMAGNDRRANFPALGIWGLEFLWCLEIGVWKL